jgi:hypothetical protein
VQEIKKTDQQSNFVFFIISSIMIYAMYSWLMHEIESIYVKSELDMDIVWIIQAPLMIIISIVGLISLLVLISTIVSFDFKEFFLQIEYKRTFSIIVIFNIVILSLVYIFEYFSHFLSEWVASLVMCAIMVVLIRYINKNTQINIIAFLVLLILISSLFWFIIIY